MRDLPKDKSVHLVMVVRPSQQLTSTSCHMNQYQDSVMIELESESYDLPSAYLHSLEWQIPDHE